MLLTIFYDGLCPLCELEINKLKQLDEDAQLGFVDINQPDFNECYPSLDWHTLDARIHGRLQDGSMISGLDVTYLAWKLVGKGWVYAPLRWPIISWFADRFYNLFARDRKPISSLLMGKRTADYCEKGTKSE
jgi:predicted DCC family thiol-disulfide oxidoreductase YuxK